MLGRGRTRGPARDASRPQGSPFVPASRRARWPGGAHTHIGAQRLSQPDCPPGWQGVRTKTVKKAARVIIEKYYARMTMDFQTNKRVCEEVAIIPSKALKNKIAGYATHLMKRIQRGPVRGISLKLQEEERERRMDFVPDVSAVDVDVIEVDQETKAMLRSLDMAGLGGLIDQQSSAGGWKPGEKKR